MSIVLFWKIDTSENSFQLTIVTIYRIWIFISSTCFNSFLLKSNVFTIFNLAKCCIFNVIGFILYNPSLVL